MSHEERERTPSEFRVVLIDDHEHALEGMREIVGTDPAFRIIAEGRSGHEAVRLAEEHLPDLMLMDISMPGMDGLEATRIVKSRCPSVKIVIVTISDDIMHLFDAIKKGAQGYLIKNLSPSSWQEYLRAVAMDEAPLSRELAFRILQEFRPLESDDRTVDNPLTSREQDILERVARGLSNREIAERLNISEYTVKNHLKNILQKLHLENRVQLARYAYEHGWIRNGQ